MVVPYRKLTKGRVGATVARPPPERKVGCSNHSLSNFFHFELLLIKKKFVKNKIFLGLNSPLITNNKFKKILYKYKNPFFVI